MRRHSQIWRGSSAAAPTISADAVLIGTPVVGVATAYVPATVAGIPTPAQSGIQWTLDGSNIVGATSATYTPVAGDVGHTLRVKETWTNSSGSVTSTSAGVAVIAAGVGTLAITWELPTANADGSAIGTITGQTIYYDTVSRMGTGTDYANSQAVGNGTSVSATITGLVAGVLYYYALTVTVAGVESDYGVELSGTAS